MLFCHASNRNRVGTFGESTAVKEESLVFFYGSHIPKHLCLRALLTHVLSFEYIFQEVGLWVHDANTQKKKTGFDNRVENSIDVNTITRYVLPEHILLMTNELRASFNGLTLPINSPRTSFNVNLH